MNESLFQYLWQYNLFQPSGLLTTDGDSIQIISSGTLNTDSGPDFKGGKIKIKQTIWVGNIELHVKSSDWLKHKHQEDPAFNNIILHVVYENDQELPDTNFPTLELKNQIDTSVINHYENLMSKLDKIPCHDQLPSVPELHLSSWYGRLIAERWEQKLKEWETLWIQSNNDWRTLLYYRMAANFGFHVNRDAFLELALSLPLNILIKHRKSLTQTEALLFGQSGLLNLKKHDEYSGKLEKEYHFLRRKYSLEPMKAEKWKFMRMRPANFPTIRIAQFAFLLHKSLELFSKMMEIRSAKEMMPLLNLEASEYWQTHYRFSEISTEKSKKKLGIDAINNILINTVAPMQFLYAKLQGQSNLQETSMNLLQSLPPENNNIIREWKERGIKAKDALESQALIQLFQNYCSSKDCLNCSIGHFLLKRNPDI